jgi:predicted lipoprotein with Yx(FWY)xxD motif
MRARLVAACSLGLLALLVRAGCGGSSNGGAATAAAKTGSSSGSARNAGGMMVDLVRNPQLGQILVDRQGRTLYLFRKDTNNRSNCAAGCAKIWPPYVTTGSPKAGTGVNASMLGTAKRSDGSMQVTYGGHPLYTYTADTSAGQTSGNGVNSFGAVWSAVMASGSAAPAGGSSGSGGSSGVGGGTSPSGGYGY